MTWDFVGRHARRLIASAATVENIKSVPMGTIPQTERHARPLSRLEPAQQREAWTEATRKASNLNQGHNVYFVYIVERGDSQKPAGDR